MKELEGKKLLILSGNTLSCDIVRTAKEMGVYTIVTDWYDADRSPAKLLCDERWDVSTTDYNELVRRINERHIDGILTGFSDSYLLPYQKLCELTNLPCYATREQFEWSLDKKAFKEKCRKYCVPVVPEYPVDNSGSRGICICEKPDEFEEKLNYSLGFSEKKVVVIERYMDCDDVSFEYKIQDGKVTLTSICDRYIYKTQTEGSITSKLIYPSKYTDAYLADVDKRVRKMFEAEGLKNGVLFMQAFVEDDNFYFYEMGYRLSGGRHYIFTKNQNGESAVEELINFAITGQMSNNSIADVANPYFKDICSLICIICQSDIIEKIEGWKEIAQMPQIIESTLMHNVGSVVGKQGTTASIVARLHIVANSIEELNKTIDVVYSVLKVKNSFGDNLVIKCC